MHLKLDKTKLLWSGGFDSTYILLDLLSRGERVETTYLDYGDPSYNKRTREMESQECILKQLPAWMKSNLTTNRVEFWKSEMAVEYGKILESGELPESNTQNPGLLAVARIIPGISTGLLPLSPYAPDDSIKIRAEFLNSGMKFPLAGMTKHLMLDDAKSRGFDHLLDLTWSCEGSKDRTPCGKCMCCCQRVDRHGGERKVRGAQRAYDHGFSTIPDGETPNAYMVFWDELTWTEQMESLGYIPRKL